MFRDKFSKTFEMCLVLNEKPFTIDKHFLTYIQSLRRKFILVYFIDYISPNNIKYHMKYTAKNTNINLISCKAEKVAHNVSQMKIEIL